MAHYNNLLFMFHLSKARTNFGGGGGGGGVKKKKKKVGKKTIEPSILLKYII